MDTKQDSRSPLLPKPRTARPPPLPPSPRPPPGCSVPSSPPARLQGTGANFQALARCPYPSTGTHRGNAPCGQARPGARNTRAGHVPRRASQSVAKVTVTLRGFQQHVSRGNPRGPCPHSACSDGQTRPAHPPPWARGPRLSADRRPSPDPSANESCRDSSCPSRGGDGKGAALPWSPGERGASLLGTRSRGRDARGGHLICGNHQPRCGRGFWGPT